MEGKKYRHEYKYVITDTQARMIQTRLDSIMQKDIHAGKTGNYLISSLYYDDYYNRCFYENENGTDPREKFRIRIYNGFADRISLECKRKERGKTLKTAAIISESYAREMMTSKAKGYSADCKKNNLLLRFEREIFERNFHPAVIVEYERIPYVCSLGNVRVTFDYNLSSSTEVDKFLDGGYSKRLVMPVGYQLMEVKFDELIPDYIYQALQIENLQQTAYSKYYLCRKIHM